VIVGDGSDPGRFICTTSHPDEALADVLNLARDQTQAKPSRKSAFRMWR
jgi:hypothetical protein